MTMAVVHNNSSTELLSTILHAKALFQEGFEPVPKACLCCKCFHPFSVSCQSFPWGEGDWDKSPTHADAQAKRTNSGYWLYGYRIRVSSTLPDWKLLTTHHQLESQPRRHTMSPSRDRRPALLLSKSRITHVNHRLKTFHSHHFGVTKSVIVWSRRQKEGGRRRSPF